MHIIPTRLVISGTRWAKSKITMSFLWLTDSTLVFRKLSIWSGVLCIAVMIKWAKEIRISEAVSVPSSEAVDVRNSKYDGRWWGAGYCVWAFLGVKKEILWPLAASSFARWRKGVNVAHCKPWAWEHVWKLELSTSLRCAFWLTSYFLC